MPRFVLLRHECPPQLGKPSHWDFMLEGDGALLTWSVATLPTADGPSVAAQRLGNHRLAYLDYEGPVSGGRGDVCRADAGEFQWLEQTPVRLRIVVRGAILRGTLRIEPCDGAACQLSLIA